MEVSIAAESLAHIGNFSITNTLAMTLLVSVFIIGVALVLRGRLALVPRGLQNIVEAFI